MRNSKLFWGVKPLLFICFATTIGISTAQSESVNQNIFRYAVNNQVITKNQKQNLFSVLKDLNKTRGIYFLFSDSSIANKQVAVPDMNGFVDDILNEVLKNTGLKYKKISKNTFVITSDKPTAEKSTGGTLYNLIETPYGELIFASVKTAYYAPPRKIIGKIVSSKDGKPIEGVSIKVKGQKGGTTTKADGTFTLDVSDNATLEISAIGYLTTTSKVNSSGVLSITLQEAALDLEDVVVVAYGTQKRSSFTGAATSVKQQMMEDVPRTSFQESLQGNAVGVLSTNGSGQPGGVPSIRIRGIGSISASSAPLYVIDGIPVVSGDISNGFNSNTIAALNPLDIQSTVVLKDAAATALYGSRGANGVILVTTKRGKAGKATVLDSRIQTGITFNNTLNNPLFKTLSTTQMLEYLRDAWKNSSVYNKGDFITDKDGLLANVPDTTPNTDWFKQVLRTGKYSNVSISASGGNEKTTFYFSGGFYQQDGIQKGTDYQKITTLININHKVSDKFSLSAGISGTYQLANSSIVGAVFQNPTRAMYRLQNWLKPTNPDGSYRTDYNNGYNPVAIQSTNIRRTSTYVLRGTTNGIYKVAKGLTYETTLGIDFSHAYNLSYNDPRYGNANVAAKGSISNYAGDIANWIWTNMVRYKKTINGDNNFEIFGGYEASKRTDANINATAFNLSQINMYSISDGSRPGLPTSTVEPSSLVSQFANGTYSFKNRYYLSASARNDRSSRFGDLKDGQFWSVGAGWDMHKEKFFNINWIYELRLRGSYGCTGNSIGLSNYGAYGLYDITTGYNDQPGMTYSQMKNGGLTWEKNYPLNFGFEASFLQNRIATSFDWYTRKTTDLIINQLLPATSGVTSVSGNFAQMRNEGFEIVINTININPKKKGGFKWTSQINYSVNRNKILKYKRSTSGDYVREEGGDFYQWYLKKYQGADSTTGLALWKDSAKGYVRDTTNWGSGSYYKQGSALPTFYGSFTNVISYKGFSLMAQIYVSWGNKIYDQNGIFNSSDGSNGFSATGNVSYYDYLHRWKKPGDKTDVPAPVYFGTQTGLSSQPSTRFLYDGSYIRLRDIMLSYDFPASILSKAKLSTTRVYLRASNLYTYRKDKRLYYDPETPVDGTINLRPPSGITILLGANINF